MDLSSLGDQTMSRDRGPDRRGFQRRSSTTRILIGSIVVIAILHLARPVVIPIALAILLAFLFRPVVATLERTFLRRTGSVVVTLAVAVGIAVLSTWALTIQVNSLVREVAAYSGNLERKLHLFRADSGGSIALIERTLQRLAQSGQPQERADMKVRVIPEPKGIADRYRRFAPTFEFLASAFLVVVLLFFLLRDREQFRDKLLRLSGRANVTVTTQAIGETLNRISRYLVTQSALNAGFGLLIGLTLFAFGLPHSFLWGVFAGLARFIPYIGAAVSAALPTILALAVYPGWYEALGVLALFLLMDHVIGGFVEPLVIGHRVGVSPVMILLATIFWGWLWGPVGMILATPIIVSLTVAGEFIPALRVFSIIFGKESVLEDYLSFYNRLISRDRAGAIAIADRYSEANTMEQTFMDLFVPTLTFAAGELQRGRVTSVHDHFIKDVTRELVIRLGDRNAAAPEPGKQIVAVSVGGERLSLGTLMLVQVLRADGFAVDTFTDLSIDDLLLYIRDEAPEAVFVSCSNPTNLEKGYQLLATLSRTFPDLIILAGGSAFGRKTEKTLAAGATIVPTNLREAKEDFARERRARGTRGPRRTTPAAS